MFRIIAHLRGFREGFDSDMGWRVAYRGRDHYHGRLAFFYAALHPIFA